MDHTYQAVTSKLQTDYKQQLKVPLDSQVLLITGGSSGASAINNAMKQIVIRLLDEHPKLYVFHQVGKGKLDDFGGIKNDRMHLLEFLSPMFAYMGAADVVVTRASGNTLAELGVQGKPAIAIPSPVLADGHQLRNADYLQKEQAALIVHEEALPEGLYTAISQLLNHPEEGRALAQKLQHSSPSGAAKKLAKLLVEL